MRLRHGLGSVATGVFACLAACEDDSGTLPPFQFDSPDGGTPPVTQPDAPTKDASPDAVTVTKVNVTALSRWYEPLASQAPRAGVLVFAVNGAGALVGQATTGVDGRASLEIPDGGSVTAVYPKNDDRARISVVTYAGVKPGDSLTFGDHDTTYGAPVGSEGNLDIQWTPVTDATSYELTSPCASATTNDHSMTVGLASTCQTPTAPVALVASDSAGRVLASVFLPDAPYTPGSSLNITAGQWVSQTASMGYGISVTGLAAGVHGVELRARARFGRIGYERLLFVSPFEANATGAFSMPSTATTIAGAEVYRNDYPGHLRFLQTAQAPVTLDTTGRPWVTSIVASAKERFVQWLLSPGTAYDATTLELAWNKNDTEYVWRVLLPPDKNQVDLRSFPEALAAYLPDTESPLNVALRLIDLSSTKSYDDVRALPEWHFMDPEFAVRFGEEPGVTAADGGEGYDNFRY